jgi:hypothetical protein
VGCAVAVHFMSVLMMYDNDLALADINANNLFDLRTTANFLFEDDDWPNPYLNINFDSQFYDIDTFTNSFLNYSNPIFISLNVKSLLSKHESLSEFLSTMLNKGIPVCAVAVQERSGDIIARPKSKSNTNKNF